MNYFLVPAIVLVVVFWLCFGLTYFALRGRIGRLERRVRRIEKTLGAGQTEDFSQSQRVPPPRPRPIAPSRYVTVDREPRY